MEELEKTNNLKEVIEWILCIIIAIVLALLVRYYIFTPTEVKQKSMEPTFIQGDRLILDRLSITMKKELKRGDIITFDAPSKKEINALEFNNDNPVAVYENEPTNLFSKFTYYVLEISKDKQSYIKRIIGLPRRTCFNSKWKSIYKWRRITRRLLR